jgi:hypothetical protein
MTPEEINKAARAVELLDEVGWPMRAEAMRKLLAERADLLAACERYVAKHQERAKLANFDRCGCESCVAFRAAIERAKA